MPALVEPFQNNDLYIYDDYQKHDENEFLNCVLMHPWLFVQWILYIVREVILSTLKRLPYSRAFKDKQSIGRKSWNWIHRIIVWIMQASYRFFLSHAGSHLSEPSSASTSSYVILSDKSDVKPENDINKLESKINETHTKKRQMELGYPRFFQRLIDRVPLIPYRIPLLTNRYIHKTEIINCFELPLNSSVSVDYSTVIKGLPESDRLLNNALKVDLVSLPRDENTNPSGLNSGRKTVVLYVHGGAFNFRMEMAWRPLLQRLLSDFHGRRNNGSSHVETVFVVPHYRLAPGFKFPCALYDIASSFLWILQHYGSDGGLNILVMAESAGGSIAVSSLALIHLLLTQKLDGKDSSHLLTYLSGVYLISPWLDLTCVSETWDAYYPFDLLHRPAFPFDLGYNYARGSHQFLLKHGNFFEIYLSKDVAVDCDFDNATELERMKDLMCPLASPLFLPVGIIGQIFNQRIKVLIQLGEMEYLKQDGLSIYSKLVGAGIDDINVVETPGCPTCFICQPNNELSSNNLTSVTRDIFGIRCEIYREMTHIFPFMHVFGIGAAIDALHRAVDFMVSASDDSLNSEPIDSKTETVCC